MTSTADRIDAAGWRIVLLASLGGTLEFYDFVIFGVFARDIAAAVFPTGDPIVSLMASFAAFAAGYLARPIGGIVLSHYGDRHGRRTRVPVVGVHHVGRHAGHGPGAVVRAVGRDGERADGDTAIDPGLLSRRRVAGRADLRGGDGAANCAVCVRRGVRVRHHGRGARHRRQPLGADLSRSRAGAGVWLAHRVHSRRSRRRVEFRAAAVAGRVARVCADEELCGAPAVSRAVADQSRARAGRLRDSRRHGQPSTACSSRTCRRISRPSCNTILARRCSRRPSA